MFIEIIQFFLPYRNYSNLDLIADLIGIISGLILVKIMNFLVKNY
jgi:VanZ family protein